MLLSHIQKRGKRGFTLVELLIVVAIIGVLSTVGVPTFRRMVQKSKKSEAKVNLGGIYTAEAAFNSEYGGYGNNLARMGFEIDGDTTMIYTVGFYTTGCVDGTTAAIHPTFAASNALYGAINSAFPSYYTAAGAQGRFGANSFTICKNAYTAAANGQSYNAGAVGMIANVARSATTLDVWSIDQNRGLSNDQDGTQ